MGRKKTKCQGAKAFQPSGNFQSSFGIKTLVEGVKIKQKYVTQSQGLNFFHNSSAF